ncbi:MAG: choline dehydrogenase [Alphaproteobacteria bacterium]|nr:choline dehydrogenase [Alphaproteobacteria bacterium]MDA8004547.1 choline dehydrogenase [Alphaproteobacteria bacterium]MDA8006172.1 choline dehydrogenase [Alphaproteobacteria bacterium]MDA8013545.1 choline dehydrogenase [Alphaproteobacteria bacterium]
MEADFIIIGAGSAGSTLAHRLSEDGQNSVIALEYGGGDTSPLIQMPGALSIPMNTRRYDWGLKTDPEPHLGGRQLACPRGKVIGGSSSINGMVFVRGHREDFNFWEANGAKGWGYNDVLPYYMRMENWHGGKHGGNPKWRGANGPMHVGRGDWENPLNEVFVSAGVQAGFPRNPDYNGADQEGFGPLEQTVWRGRRWSAASAYLKPALKRKNCALYKCLARRIITENGRAVGVEVERGGQIKVVRARREVIVSASAINSPKLLMLSGIGPGEHLREHGINVIADKPGVGGNLQDHLELYVQRACPQPVTLYRHWNPLGKARVGARWLLFKTGPGASNQFESGGFVRSGEDAAYPDIQFHFLPLAVRYDGAGAADEHGFQAHVGPMRSASRGRVRLASPDPRAAPSILFNYMSAADDWRLFRRCIRLTREIFGQDAFAPYRGRELSPGEDAQSDAALDEFISTAVESAYHPCGTCRMGAADDAATVVDAECRVVGVEGLRVVDSSIFPRITNGNINAPSLLVGERAADFILGKPSLPPVEF